MRTMRGLGRLAVLGAALLVLLASKGTAQDFKGKFDLPVAARWGKADLEPGQYKLVVTRDSSVPLLRVTGMNGRTVLVMAASEDQYPPSEDSALTLANVDGRYFIRTLKAGDIGQVLTFPVPSSQEHELARRQKPNMNVSVTEAGK